MSNILRSAGTTWRRVFKQIPSKKKALWEEVSMVDLRELDIFIMFEPTGEPVKYKGEAIMIATSDTYFEDDAFRIDMTSLTEYKNFKNSKEVH